MKWLGGYSTRLMLFGFVVCGLLSMVSVCSALEYVWTQKADMPMPRWLHTSAMVNGKIYVIGGEVSEPYNKLLSTVEEYDPTTDKWTRKAAMPTERGYMAPSSPVVDGKVYVIGGVDVSNSISTVEEYNPVTDIWTRKADMPTNRYCLATVTVDGKIYAIGGNLIPLNMEGLNVVERYDPATDTWTRKANIPLGVWAPCVNVVNGKIYVFGGRPDLKSRAYVQEYDPDTDTWTRKSDMPLATSQMGSVVLGNKIIVIGGWLWSRDYPYRTIQMYDPEADSWTIEGDTPFLRACFTANVVNNRIYIIGGTDRPHPFHANPTVHELTINPPPPDFNGDGVVNGTDMSMMIDYWHTDEPFYDISPQPFGDGIVDVKDLILLSEHLFEDYRMIAHWKLDEKESNLAYDNTGNYDGDLKGNPVWQPVGGVHDGALELDGNDDYISTPFILNPCQRSFSVFAWIQGGLPGEVIISQSDTPGSRGVLPGCTWLGINPFDGKLMTGLMETSFGPLESDSIITDGQWHHIGLVYDCVTMRRHLYIDGAEIAVDTDFIGGVQTTGGLYIGAGQALDVGTFFYGMIDDVRIYDIALTADEIAVLEQ